MTLCYDVAIANEEALQMSTSSIGACLRLVIGTPLIACVLIWDALDWLNELMIFCLYYPDARACAHGVPVQYRYVWVTLGTASLLVLIAASLDWLAQRARKQHEE